MSLSGPPAHNDPVMTATRLRLVILHGAPLVPRQLDLLKSIFDVVEAADEAAARRLGDRAGTLVLGPAAPPPAAPPVTPPPAAGPDGPPDEAATEARGPDLPDALRVLGHIGEGVGVVDASGTITWANERLNDYDEQTRRSFVGRCLQAVALFNVSGDASAPLDQRPCKKFTFSSEQAHYELVVSPAWVDETDRNKVTAVVGVLWDVTASRRLQNKIDAIDAAGSELMKIEAASISQLNMAERLKLLEEKTIRYVRDLLNFDNFEIRLLDQQSNQLELVIAVGISPLKIGEVIYGEPTGNGISGYVAATGESYICPNVRQDPRYREGLDDAASSLTVPLRLHDRVIGVFNIESNTLAVFDENDRQFAEIFGRYIAMAMNILDLLVVERYRTNEQIAQTVLDELRQPLEEITGQVESLRREASGDEAIRKRIDHIVEAAAVIRRRIESCAAGPRTILGAEQHLHRHEPDPLMIGKRVLVAEDEPNIRESIAEILSQRGAEVTVCSNGAETIDAVRRNPAYDLVISDIKMPDRNGYEVFRAAKEVSADTPVILMTGFGYDPHHSIIRASQEGLQSFLFKPFKASQLIEAITKALTQPAAKT